MILKLVPDQITLYWSEIKEHLKTSLVTIGGTDDASLNRMLEAHISEKMQTWVMYVKEKEKIKVHALCTTMLQVEFGSGATNLVVYAVSGYKFIKEELWTEGITVLREFAKQNKCTYIVAYSSVSRIVAVSKTMGGDVSTTFIKWTV